MNRSDQKDQTIAIMAAILFSSAKFNIHDKYAHQDAADQATQLYNAVEIHLDCEGIPERKESREKKGEKLA